MTRWVQAEVADLSSGSGEPSPLSQLSLSIYLVTALGVHQERPISENNSAEIIPTKIDHGIPPSQTTLIRAE